MRLESLTDEELITHGEKEKTTELEVELLRRIKLLKDIIDLYDDEIRDYVSDDDLRVEDFELECLLNKN